MNQLDNQLLQAYSDKYVEYLRDESRLVGQAESISFPIDTQQVQAVLTAMAEQHINVTVQGGRTGIVGGAVPQKGHIINLSRMNQIGNHEVKDEKHLLTVQPGVTLLELAAHIRGLKSGVRLFWPVDPTEPTATVGGAVATDAKGICANYYGSLTRYIHKLEVILPSGESISFNKEDHLPALPKTNPFTVFVGSEGMLGVITSITIELIPMPSEQWGISLFFQDREKALAFSDALLSSTLGKQGFAAAEYLEKNAIETIEARKPHISAIKELPDVPLNTAAMVYVELHSNHEEEVEHAAEALLELAMEYDSDPDTAWAVSGENELDKMRAFRHGAAEAANLLVDEARRTEPRITKLATDMSLPNVSFAELAKKYRRDCNESGLQASIFGHIARGHLHVNLFPKTYEEYQKGCTLLEKWAVEMQQQGGNLSTEHGIGKLKKRYNQHFLADSENQNRRAHKEIFDPRNRFNPGNYWLDKAEMEILPCCE